MSGRTQTGNASGSQAKATRCVLPTEKLFRAAGIGPGARVLDCGSCGGDVSIIAARLVTTSGDVVGIDRDSGHVDAANRRVKNIGLPHVRFEIANIS